ncbi:MAG: hypothetical protein M3Y75_08060, partial [Actinomycetota bacterium]|nr:hypothetical protein [Actinomycetota bacterium]
MVLGVVGGAGGDEDERIIPRGELDLGVGHLEGHRPGDLDSDRPGPRVLQLRIGGHKCQVRA